VIVPEPKAKPKKGKNQENTRAMAITKNHSRGVELNKESTEKD